MTSAPMRHRRLPLCCCAVVRPLDGELLSVARRSEIVRLLAKLGLERRTQAAVLATRLLGEPR